MLDLSHSSVSLRFLFMFQTCLFSPFSFIFATQMPFSRESNKKSKSAPRIQFHIFALQYTLSTFTCLASTDALLFCALQLLQKKKAFCNGFVFHKSHKSQKLACQLYDLFAFDQSKLWPHIKTYFDVIIQIIVPTFKGLFSREICGGRDAVECSSKVPLAF